MDFSDKKAGETVTLGFDLVRVLAAGETITSAVFTSAVLRGTDATPEAMISGASSIAGSQVKQHITGGVAGCYYTVQVNATTDQGNIYIERATLEVTA